jgi:hypothetical protein
MRRDVRTPKNASSSNPAMAHRRFDCGVSPSPSAGSRWSIAEDRPFLMSATLQPLAQRVELRVDQKHPALLVGVARPGSAEVDRKAR